LRSFAVSAAQDDRLSSSLAKKNVLGGTAPARVAAAAKAALETL
jgi:hypothetical protein